MPVMLVTLTILYLTLMGALVVAAIRYLWSLV